MKKELEKAVYNQLDWEYKDKPLPTPKELWRASCGVAVVLERYFGRLRGKHIHPYSKQWLADKLLER